MKKYSDVLADWLVELGYTTVFFVAGGNIMHILESCSRRLRCVPVVHEVAAGIAAEYFNEMGEGEKALALVTAGPGLTNILTAFGGAWLESREMLVLGGQVKVPDLARGTVRQRGIQEIDGLALAAPLSVKAVRYEAPVDFATFAADARAGSTGRKGPVFIELPLDVQARQVDEEALKAKPAAPLVPPPAPSAKEQDAILSALRAAQRPVLLLGGGVDRALMTRILPRLESMGVPVMTTWNGFDRVPSDHPLYFGRPNTWGQRYANLLLQQADLILVLGSRLGLQQTGFNWQEFAPVGKVIQVECDRAELEKGHPRVDMPICADANAVLDHISQQTLADYSAWVSYCRDVKALLPLNEKAANQTGDAYLSPYAFVEKLSEYCAEGDIVIPCSSGGAFTIMMQTFAHKRGQKTISDKGSASMGYGLSGAIGAAMAGKGRRTILVEGDGGFSQNLQEVGTVAVNKLNMKIFIFMDNGYASIRMTQSNYFGGRYVGCDLTTGLGLPDWEKLFGAYGVPTLRLGPGFDTRPDFKTLFDAKGPAAFIVAIDPKQTYFPKIMSRVTETGGMVSNPLHRMSPDLDDSLWQKVSKYL